MSVLLHRLQEVVVFLGANNIVLAIVGLVAAPYVDRLLIRRNRLTYRVLYDSKIGVRPEDLLSPDDYHHPDSGPLEQLATLLDRMSMAVIRIRNTGSSEITKEDFREALSFTFGERIIWNARISDAPDDDVRRQIRRGLAFFHPEDTPAELPNDKKQEPEPGITLTTLRQTVRDRLYGKGGGANSRGVRLNEIRLGRRQRFKLVVLLLEPDGHSGSVTKGVYRFSGRLHEPGLIRDARIERKVTLPRITGAVAVGLTALLLLGVVIPAPTPLALDCGSGELTVVGSTVFMPTMRTLAAQYKTACSDAVITMRETGSVAGVREVAALQPAETNGLVAISDGKQDSGVTGLRAEQLAIVIYHVVVNTSAGVDGLSTAQLRGIYNGTYRDWSQLRGGPPLPIRIVGRGQESGTRELFEQKLLGAAEPGLTSNECLTNDRDPRAPIIRCERNANQEVVQKISQIPGAIGYADAASVAEARKSNAVTALTVDSKAFDVNTVIESGYPFWTVEYLYSRGPAASDTLQARFVDYLRKNDVARVRLNGSGYIPCNTADGAPLELCNHR